MSDTQQPAPPQAHFTHDEAKITVMALTNQLEDLKRTMQDQHLPWTPESRQCFREMITAAESARDKIASLTGINPELPEYEEGDDLKFLTRPS